MNTTKKNKGFLIFTILFYVAAIAGMAVGTVNDLQIDMALFNPESNFAQLLESFGQLVYWAMWGPAITIIFLCRRDLNESLAVINKLIPAIKPIENTDNKTYKFFNFIVRAVTTVGFFVLAMVGWKKLIENVIKNILLTLGKDDLSQVVYFTVCTVFTLVIVLLCRNLDKEKLRKVEALALAGVLLGICFKIVEECKNITCRVRFREMVAYSNNFLNDKGLSEGKYSPLTSAMAQNADFSAFTRWYKIGDDMGIYNRADSFPSGHTTYSMSLLMAYPLCRAFTKLKSLAPFALLVSIAYTIVMGFSRMVAGAHYLTDVVGAAIIGYTLFLIVLAIYNKFTEKKIIG